LAQGRAIDAAALRAAMTATFGGSDADGAWDWKGAYDVCEAATVLFLRRFGRGMLSRAATPAALLGMLSKLAALLPSQTRRSEESQALQQFSTPITYAFAASIAAAVTAADVVLEPSAGTGLLAIFAEIAGASLLLNELGDGRADLLAWLFPGIPLTRHDAAHIHDHLDAASRPSVVVMNPPFSAAAHVEGRVADAAFRHVASALSRLGDGGRLVAITGASLSPDNLAWRDSFARLQEHGRVVFSAVVDGTVFARHGTTIDTRLTVIDRLPAEHPTSFPASPGTAPDADTLLDWVARLIPPRQPTTPATGYSLEPARPTRRITASTRPVAAWTIRPAPVAADAVKVA
jgi:predicted RNA methylase